MTNQRLHDSATSNVLAWSSQAAHMQHEPEDEVAGEVDEPPDDARYQFQKRSTVRKPADNSQSLLSKALHQSDEEDAVELPARVYGQRRRSMNSNVSLTSTVDLTSDTGFTSPARTNTPSPPPPVFQLGRMAAAMPGPKPVWVNPFASAEKKSATQEGNAVVIPVAQITPAKGTPVETLVKKRCISFACGAKAEPKKPSAPAAIPSPIGTTTAAPIKADAPAVRKPCIKFACFVNPASQGTPPVKEPAVKPVETAEDANKKERSPSARRKYRSPSISRSQRSLTPRRRPSASPITVRSKKYLTANPADLNHEGSRFHEFASDEPQEDDWIRQNASTSGRRLTITDTLQKENEIRRLGKEAEEEAEQEEAEENEVDNGDGDEDDEEDEEDGDDADDVDDIDGNEDEEEDEEDEEDDVEDGNSAYGSADDFSDGYRTDNEVGFAESDDEDDAGDLADLWTHGHSEPVQPLPGLTPMQRRPVASGTVSESSTSDEMATSRLRERSRRIRIRPGTPELPDSTDFVCGTLDEDRPLEDAYISCIAQKRREKLHLIPQDIDPSFPTSGPEDEEDEPKRHNQDSDDNVWIHGELEDLHHEQDRADRRKKKGDHASPKRYHSPAPKRHHSPGPRARGRSPRRLFDRHSPRKLISPPPSGRIMTSPPASPQSVVAGQQGFKTLAFRPGLTHTKSLPRASGMFPNHLRNQRRKHGAKSGSTRHVRGAIDIVKGLEQKRERRKEKYVQKYCSRARKGQIPEKRPQPGKGAERMRDIGLHIAGKTGHHPYVLSV